jgi:hypothetical protein
MKVPIPKEIVDGIRERQEAVETLSNNLKEAGEASFEASAAYCDAKDPDGFRGDYLVPLCVFIESTFKVWLDFLGGSKKELLCLRAAKEEKQWDWARATAEKERKEEDLNGYIGEYLKSEDPEYEYLAEQSAAVDKLFKATEDFVNLFYEATDSMNGQGSEKERNILKHNLAVIDLEFSTVKRAVMAYLPVVSQEREIGIKDGFQKAYGSLVKGLEKAKESQNSPEAYHDFFMLSAPVLEFCTVLLNYREELDGKIRARIDPVLAECLKES